MPTTYIHTYVYDAAFDDTDCCDIVKFVNAEIATERRDYVKHGFTLNQLILSIYLPEHGSFYAGDTYSANDAHHSGDIANDLRAAYDLTKAPLAPNGSHPLAANLLIYNAGAVTILCKLLQ